MTADTLKTTRVLELYQDFLSGKLINKQQAAEQYHVNVRSIQRDIDSIRDFLSEQCAKEGIVRKIEYDKKENGYHLVTQEIEQLPKVRFWPCARFCWKAELLPKSRSRSSCKLS